ncbi:MAG TPA: PA14 domain-containing protein [Enhygromyxa sp.]|nr:PA14 domain-containing protein [Enhygromyxa sp.]
MNRTYLSLATIPALALAGLMLAGCAKNNDSTQNPDGTAGDSGSVDGSDGTDGASDGESKPSRARTSSAPRGADGKVKVRKVTTQKPPRAPVKPDEGQGPNGLLAEAFELESVEALPTDFASLGAAKQSFPVANLDLYQVDSFPGLTAVSENFAMRFSGSINIVEEAEYQLCMHSDDGSQLLLEGTLVVDNDGVLDSPVEACELVYLPAGEYGLEIRYFQTSGPVTLQFAWGMNGGEKGIVPTDVLFKPAAR